MAGISCFTRHGVRGIRLRWSPLLTQRKYTTENHGGARRFITLSRHATINASADWRRLKRHGPVYPGHLSRHGAAEGPPDKPGDDAFIVERRLNRRAYHISVKLIAWTVAGPVSPCNSVVLGVLRGKTLNVQHNSVPTLRPATTGSAMHPPPACPP